MADETKGKKGGIMDTKVSRRTFLKHAGNALRVLGIANQLPPGMLDLLDTAKAASPIYTSNMIDFRSVVTIFKELEEITTIFPDSPRSMGEWEQALTEGITYYEGTEEEYTSDAWNQAMSATGLDFKDQTGEGANRLELSGNSNMKSVQDSYNETVKYFTDNGIPLKRVVKIMSRLNDLIGVKGERYDIDDLRNKGSGVFEKLSGKTFHTPSVTADQLKSLFTFDDLQFSDSQHEIKVLENWLKGHIDYMGTAEALNEWNNSMKLDLDAKIESLGENVNVDAVKNAELTKVKTANQVEYLTRKYPKLFREIKTKGGEDRFGELSNVIGSSANDGQLYEMKLLQKHGVSPEDLDLLQDLHVANLDRQYGTGGIDSDMLGTNLEGDQRIFGPFWDENSTEQVFNYNIDTKSFEPWIPDNTGSEMIANSEVPESSYNYWNNVKNYVIPANKAGIEVNDDVKLLAKPDYLNEVFKESKSSPKLISQFGNFLWKNKLNIARNVLENLPQEWKDQISNLPKRLLEAGKEDLKQIDEEIRNLPETIRQEVQDAKKFYLEEIRGIKEPEQKLIEPPTQEDDLLSFVPGTYTDKALEGGQRFV
jgi:hypothetical protein